MDLDHELAELGVPTALADLVREVVAHEDVELTRKPGYISIRPDGRSIAAYVNEGSVDIAVEPARSAGVAIRTKATRVQKKTTATHYVRLEEGFDHDAALAEILQAIEWRAKGPRWSGVEGPGGASDIAGETCGTCWTTLAKNGTCSCD